MTFDQEIRRNCRKPRRLPLRSGKMADSFVAERAKRFGQQRFGIAFSTP